MSGPGPRLFDENGVELVIVTGRLAMKIHRITKRAFDRERHDNGGLDPELVEYLEAVTRSREQFERFRAEAKAEAVEQPRPGSGSSAEVDERTLVDVKTASVRLDVTARRVRQLIAEEVLTSIPTQRGHHRLLVAELAGYLEHRKGHDVA